MAMEDNNVAEQQLRNAPGASHIAASQILCSHLLEKGARECVRGVPLDYPPPNRISMLFALIMASTLSACDKPFIGQTLAVHTPVATRPASGTLNSIDTVVSDMK